VLSERRVGSTLGTSGVGVNIGMSAAVGEMSTSTGRVEVGRNIAVFVALEGCVVS